MGLIKAAMGAASGVMGDQWKEYFYCDALPAEVLAVKGQKRTNGRSANRHGSENQTHGQQREELRGKGYLKYHLCELEYKQNQCRRHD